MNDQAGRPIPTAELPCLAADGQRVLHKTEGFILINIKVYKLSSNTTPFNQPLDAGIIRAFKAGFAQRRDRNAAKYVNSTEKTPYKVDVLSDMQWAIEI